MVWPQPKDLIWPILAVSSSAFVQMRTPFAQQEIATPTTITGAFIFISVLLVGVIVWILKHVFMTTIPSIVAELKSERESNESNINKICENFKIDMAAERKMCAEQNAEVSRILTALIASTAQGQQASMAEINRHTTEQVSAYRHEMRDDIQQAVLGREVFLEQQKRRQQDQRHPT